MQDLLERKPKLETSPQPTARRRLARAALMLLEVIPHPLKRTTEKPAPETQIDLADTGSHHIKDQETDLTVSKLQTDLANEARWKQEFDALLPKTPEEQKQRLYEQAIYDPTVLVAPEPEMKSKVITFSSTDQALLDTLHKHSNN